MNPFSGPPLLWLAHAHAPDETSPRAFPARAGRGVAGERVPSILASVLAVCFSLAVLPVRAQEALPRDRLTRLESVALAFYDHVRRDRWPEAEVQLRQIAKLSEPVITRFDAASAPLAKAVVKSARAIHHHDRDAALHAANKIIEWAASERGGAQANVPPELIRLGFLARELQIETDAGNAGKLAARVGAIRQCWEQLKAALETSGEGSLARDGEEAVRPLEPAAAAGGSEEAQAALFVFIEEAVRHFDQGGRR